MAPGERWCGVQACDVEAEIAKPKLRAHMTMKLAVAGAFHADYLVPAVDEPKEALASTTMTMPRIVAVPNVVDAQPHSDPNTIKDVLARQV